MATIEEQHYNAVQTMFESLTAAGFDFVLRKEPYDNPAREYDAEMELKNGTTVLVVCMNEGLDVEITPPQNVVFLFEDEFKPILLKENAKEFRYKRLQMKLSSDVIIECGSPPPSDRVYLKQQHGAYNRLEVFLMGPTCVPAPSQAVARAHLPRSVDSELFVELAPP